MSQDKRSNSPQPEIRAEELRFCLMPSTNPPPSLVDLHNKTFSLWREVWGTVFSQLKYDTSHLEDDFVRQNLIACISRNGEPIAAHLYKFFSVDSQAARAQAYLRDNYPEIFFAKLRALNVRTVMSMEYMTLHPEWRRSSARLATVLGGLALYTMREFGQDGAIAPCRKDFKVQEIAYAYGGECVIADVMNHNVLCDLVVVRNELLHPHATPEVQGLLDALWEKREYIPACTPATEGRVLQFPLKKAA